MKSTPRLRHLWIRTHVPQLHPRVTAVLRDVVEIYRTVCEAVGLFLITGLLVGSLFWGTIRSHVITMLFGAAPCQAVWVQALMQINDAPACQGPPMPTLP